MGKKKRDRQLPSDAELLKELTSMEHMEVTMPGDDDHFHGSVPPWCEVVLDLKHKDARQMVRHYLTRHDGELIIHSMHDALHPGAGGTVAEMLFMELDDVVDRIQARVERGKEPLKHDAGQALGLCTAIAIMRNPSAYDVEAVKEEAMVRFDLREMTK